MTDDDKRTEVVLRYRGGRAVRCRLVRDFEPGVSRVEAETSDGEVLRVPLQDLKAVFFLKDERRRRVDKRCVPETPAGSTEPGGPGLLPPAR